MIMNGITGQEVFSIDGMADIDMVTGAMVEILEGIAATSGKAAAK